MGTRADFYVGRGDNAEWLGSLAWDGYPDGIPAEVGEATTEQHFRDGVARLCQGRRDGTHPAQGWPWPWANSATTDYAYAFDAGRVHVSNFGSAWCLPEATSRARGPDAIFPDMTAQQRVTLGRRSGVMVIGPQGVIEEEEP